jgi:integrase
MRPSEVRALREKDVDLFNNILSIKQHLSRNEILPGRKSNGDAHFLHLEEEDKEMLAPFITGNPDAYLFKGAHGGFMAEKVLLEAWKRAVQLVGLPYIDLYTGTKHTTMTQMIKEGHSLDAVRTISGHESVESAKRYGQRTMQTKLDAQKVLRMKKKEG